MTNEKLLAMWKQKLPNVEPTNQELTAFALGVEVGAAVEGPSEAVKFTDQSTADPVEKARRYLSAMGSNHLHSSYFFDDGYPKQESATDALATLAVLEQLAAAPTTQPAPQQEASPTAGMNIAQRIFAAQRVYILYC
jgi:hypothetical protein